MPRLTPELRDARRRHVLHSAWRCFGRQGFHATTMDEVIAETGWSSSAVYRYFAGKDELIVATARESLDLFGQILTELLAREPTPSPHEAVVAIVEALRSGDPDLSALVVQNWSEALRNPAVAGMAQAFWTDARRRIATLTRRWQDDGTVASTVDPGGVAAALVLLVPGLVLDAAVLDGAATRRVLRAVAPPGRRRRG